MPDLVDRPGGLKIPYVVQGDGNGPHIVFAHGLMGTGTYQRAQLPPLVDAGWTVVTFDQRGHAGASRIVDAAGYDPVEMGEDLWAVADAAGIDRCWIGGGSMGAATSFRAATARPERVEGLIQAVPALHDAPHGMIWGFDAVADSLKEAGIEGFIETLRKISASMGGEPDEAFFTGLRTHDPASLECALRTVPRWILPDVPSGFATLDFPIFAIGWHNDPIHPFETAAEIARTAGVDVIEFDQTTTLSDPPALGRLLVELLAKVRA